jgi:hypothetical protein
MVDTVDITTQGGGTGGITGGDYMMDNDFGMIRKNDPVTINPLKKAGND